jgi:poly-beta-hydroxyalkanoate depolymerase
MMTSGKEKSENLVKPQYDAENIYIDFIQQTVRRKTISENPFCNDVKINLKQGIHGNGEKYEDIVII